MGTEMLLDVHGLKIDYSSPGGTVHAVDGVSFTAAKGEIFVIVGESGSGKSTLGLSIPGLIDRSNGSIRGGSIKFKGKDLVGLSERELRGFRGQEIAMIFQNARASLNPVTTIGRQLVETLQSADRSMTVKSAIERSVELLRLVGIPDPRARLDTYPHQLSGGMCQRVMIALGISLNPSLLIADEPTSALDVTVKVQILQLLKRLIAELDMGIILITHDLGVARALADRVGVMYAGQIVEIGPAAEILNSPRMPYTQALFGSLPKLHGERVDRLPAIPSRPPSLISPPTGCRFAPRCAHAASICDSAPSLVKVGDDRLSRCNYPHDPEMRAAVVSLENISGGLEVAKS
jgi:oligopeptide/dipeptide ABC transporter ATP-binding protein